MASEYAAHSRSQGNDTSAETYGEPQTPAELPKSSTASYPAKRQGATSSRILALLRVWRLLGGSFILAQKFNVLGRNRAPGEMALLGKTASLDKRFAVSAVGQNTSQRRPKLVLRPCRQQHDTC